jgi:predicted phosphoribosyltransferase
VRRNRAHALRKSSKTPLELLAIGYWYEYFEQVSDEEEVAELIERSRGAKVGETNDSDT